MSMYFNMHLQNQPTNQNSFIHFYRCIENRLMLECCRTYNMVTFPVWSIYAADTHLFMADIEWAGAVNGYYRLEWGQVRKRKLFLSQLFFNGQHRTRGFTEIWRTPGTNRVYCFIYTRAKDYLYNAVLFCNLQIPARTFLYDLPLVRGVYILLTLTPFLYF